MLPTTDPSMLEKKLRTLMSTPSVHETSTASPQGPNLTGQSNPARFQVTDSAIRFFLGAMGFFLIALMWNVYVQKHFGDPSTKTSKGRMTDTIIGGVVEIDDMSAEEKEEVEARLRSKDGV